MSVLVVHIEQIDCVTDLVSVEDALLDENRWKTPGVGVDNGRSDATAGALATYHD